MSDWRLPPAISLVQRYNSAQVYRFAVASANAAHTKGSWIEITSATGFDTYLLCVDILAIATSGVDALFDIGIGAAGSEISIVNNLSFYRSAGGNRVAETYRLPIFVPAGTRISVRLQTGHSATNTIYGNAYCIGGSSLYPPFSGELITTYGANTADSGGISVDSGGTVDTKGLYSQLSASCLGIKAFFFCIGNQANAARSGYYHMLDISVGGAGVETVVIGDYTLLSDTTTDMISPTLSPVFPIAIPAGTRIAARASCSGNDATDRLFDVILYGVS